MLQGLDLSGLVDRLLRHPLTSTFFFGCQASAMDLGRLIQAGASVFPQLAGLPFDPNRSDLYTQAVEALRSLEPLPATAPGWSFCAAHCGDEAPVT